MITEEQFLSKRVSLLPRRGAEKEHTWAVLETDLPPEWLQSKPRNIVKRWTNVKTGVEWTFQLRWVKGRPTPILRVYR